MLRSKVYLEEGLQPPCAVSQRNGSWTHHYGEQDYCTCVRIRGTLSHVTAKSAEVAEALRTSVRLYKEKADADACELPVDFGAVETATSVGRLWTTADVCVPFCGPCHYSTHVHKQLMRKAGMPV